MSNKKNLLIFCVLITQLSVIQAFPTRLTRMILLKDDGSIQQTVDLISDTHLRHHQQICKPYKQQAGLITPQEKQAFTTPERTLLITLRKLAETSPDKIDLLWEYSDEKGLPRECTFIAYAGMQAKKEFTDDKQVIFKDIDTLRESLGLENKLLYFEDTEVTDRYYLQNFQEKCNNLKNQLAQELGTTKINDPNYTTFLSSIIKNLSNMDTEIGKITHQLGPSPTLKDTLVYTEKHAGTFRSILLDLWQDITDYEIIRTIFNKKDARFIVYAGGAHCGRIKDQLERYKYVTMLNVGSYDENFAFRRLPPLSHTAWKFLLETPNDSLKRYKEEGEWYGVLKNKNAPFVHLALLGKIDEWHALFKKNGRRPPSDDAFLKKMKEFFQHGKETYTNFLEAREDDGRTALFDAVDAGYLKSVEYLLKHHARVNAFNNKGETPIFYALYSKEMVELLLKNDANPTIVTNNGISLQKHLEKLPRKNTVGREKITTPQLKKLIKEHARAYWLEPSFTWRTAMGFGATAAFIGYFASRNETVKSWLTGARHWFASFGSLKKI